MRNFAADSLPFEADFTRRNRLYAHDGASDRRLAGTAFADDAERFAPINVEADVPNGEEGVPPPPERHADVFDAEQHFFFMDFIHEYTLPSPRFYPDRLGARYAAHADQAAMSAPCGSALFQNTADGIQNQSSARKDCAAQTHRPEPDGTGSAACLR